MGHGIQKLRAEAFLLKWLVQSSGVPVPRILSFPDDQHSNILIMDKLPGTMLLNIYGTLDISAKVCVDTLTFVSKHIDGLVM